MDTNRVKVIACATVIEEMLPHMPNDMAYEILDFGLHRDPANLKTKLQETIDSSNADYDSLLLGYGLCSMAVIGINSRSCTLVIPKMDDCISIFLGSRQAYLEQSHKDPGSYYLTKGWIEVSESPFTDYERLIVKYGKERADRVMKAMLGNYTRLVYINTGNTNKERYAVYAQDTAKEFNLRYEEIQGSNAIIKKLLNGPWDKDFVVIEPGKTIVYDDFMPMTD